MGDRFVLLEPTIWRLGQEPTGRAERLR